MSHPKYDIIVIGTGSMGSAACYFLAGRGQRVLGLEQEKTVPHENGSHTGQSRIIRKAYFEHPGYVPLLEKAYRNWDALEALSGEKIFYRTGLLYTGPRHHPVMKGVRSAAEQYGITLETISDPSRFPEFKVGKTDEMLLEPDAGFRLHEKAISCYLREAKKAVSGIRIGEKLLPWK